MRINNLKYLALIILTSWFLQSCSDEINADNDIVAEEFRDRSGHGDGGDRDDDLNTLPVRALDNDILEDWTVFLLELERYAAGMRPNASARALAYIYLTAYETAIPGMRNYNSNSRRLEGLDLAPLSRGKEIDHELALNTAFAIAIDHFLINLPSDLEDQIQVFQNENEIALSQTLASAVVEDSKNWGSYIAEEIIAYSLTDDAAESQITDPQPASYEPPIGTGYWTYSADPERALFPYWESVRTFVISSEETSSVPPLQYSTQRNSPYFMQMQEVQRVNNRARAEQNDELHIAEFWSDDVEGLMMSPPARQISIAEQLIDQYDLDLEESLVLFLKLGFSLNDAAVSTWADKYKYMVMRPSNFIHEFIDDTFQTNLYRLIYWPNPSFPGYPSGHSCFASAAAGIFIDAFGNRTDFTDRTHEGRTEFLGEPRQFRSFSQMADENGYSRIPLGVHVRMDCTEGLRLGYEIADAVKEIRLRSRT